MLLKVGVLHFILETVICEPKKLKINLQQEAL